MPDPVTPHAPDGHPYQPASFPRGAERCRQCGYGLGAHFDRYIAPHREDDEGAMEGQARTAAALAPEPWVTCPYCGLHMSPTEYREGVRSDALTCYHAIDRSIPR